MKVLDNLENYEIPSNFHLTPEEEIQFAADLKEIVNALIPKRISKLQTRTYFNQCLRISSNEKEFNAAQGKLDPLFDDIAEYSLKEGEYNWNSDLLQPALLDILKVDEHSFGFIVNFLNQDIAYRKGQRQMRGGGISDAVVKFSLKFDIEEIRAKAKSYENLLDRLAYLNNVFTDFRVYDGLTQDEEEWIAGPIGNYIKALQDEAQKELELAQARGTVNLKGETLEKKAEKLGKSHSNKFDVTRGMLYDFGESQKEAYKPLAIVPPDRWNATAPRNIKAFTNFIDYFFETCYDDKGGLIQNEATFKFTPQLLQSMMNVYATDLKELASYSDRVILKRVTQWVSQTHKLIEKAHENHPNLVSEDEPYITDNDIELPSVSTFGFKKALLSAIYESFPFVIEDYIPLLPDSLANEVPYNVWRNEYQTLKDQYSNTFGLEFRKKAVIRVGENIELYKQILMESCVTYCNQRDAEKSFSGGVPAIESVTETFTEIFHSMFRDYLQRVSVMVGNKEDIDAALLCWVYGLLNLLQTTYENEHISIEVKTSSRYSAGNYCHEFFYDICSRIVINLALGYFDDYDRLDLIPGRVNVVVDTNTVSEEEVEGNAENVKDDIKKELAHSKTIDYTALYNAWNGKAFTNISIDEFTHAIDYADFQEMLQKAKEAGDRRGFIGGVKYIMRALKDHLGKSWYKTACYSIDEDENSVNKVNDGTAAIKKINIKNIGNYVR